MTHPIHDQVRSALEACGVTVPEGTDLHARTPITGEQLMGLRATTDAEYETALTWAREHLTIGENRNPEANRFTQEEYDEQFDYCIKMLLIGRDLMEGNPALAELGFVEESEGHDAIAAGFQGQRQ